MAHNPVAVMTSIAAAMMFARRKHPDRQRRSAYLDHLFFTWYVLLFFGSVADMTILVAALVQHVLKDGQTTPEQLEKAVGPQVRRVAEELRGTPKPTQPARRGSQPNWTREFSDAAKLVLLADTIVRLRTLRIGRTIDENERDLIWAENVVRATRGINASLDLTAEKMLAHARRLLEDARHGRYPAQAQKRSRERYNDPYLKADAEAGIGELTIFWDNARTARVKIDARPEFTLPLTLAYLLWTIAFLGKPGRDGLSGWVPKAVIVAELERRKGLTYKGRSHPVDRLLYRLQDALYKNAVNPRLVDLGRKQRGARFRLRIAKANFTPIVPKSR
jgi:hypothetical protein